MELKKNLGIAIKKLRKNMGLSQEKLAIDAEVDRRYLSDIENGTRNVSLEVLEKLAAALCMPLSEVIKRAEEISNPLTVEKLKEILCERGSEDSVVLDTPDYITAFIGITDDDRVVYSYNRMVEYLMAEDGMSYEDAADFVGYATMRALPYAGEKAPIILYEPLY